jgi:hypothetical protein
VVNLGPTDGRLNLWAPGFEEEDEPDSGWDFTGLGNPRAMRDFMTACDVGGLRPPKVLKNMI